MIRTPLNEVFPKLNLPFRKGYSPNKMNKEMLLVHINVILPPSKSVLITVFKKAAWLRRTGTQLPCVGRQLSGGVTQSVFPWRGKTPCSFVPVLFLFREPTSHPRRAEEKPLCQWKVDRGRLLLTHLLPRFLTTASLETCSYFSVERHSWSPRS